MSGVEIRVRANTTQARGELQKLEKSVGKIQSVTSGLANSIKSAVAAYSGFVSVKGIVSAADSLKNLENSIALVTGRGKESQAALQRLYAIAARGRSSIDTTTATFNRFGLALSDAGKSTEEILAVTEVVAKAATLSGASAESARAAIVQLGQGLASGELRGEELNSVLEQTPRIAQAIADGMGKPFGELRSLAKDGQITSEAVFEALISQIGAIEKEFLTLEPTVGSLSTVMRDEFTRALAAIDDIAGFSENARGKIELLTTAFRFIADNAKINFLILRIELRNLARDFTDTAKNLYNTVSLLFSESFTVQGFKDSLTAASDSLKEFIGLTNEDGQESSFQKLFAKIPPLDLSGYLPNLSEIVGNLTSFAVSVKDIFFDIFNDVILNSTWSSLFWKGTDRIGGPKFTAAIQDVLSKLSGWATKIKTLFQDVFLGARDFNQFGEAGRGERSGGIVSYFEGGTTAIGGFVSAISSAITESSALNKTLEFFQELPTSIKNAAAALGDYTEARGGAIGIANSGVDAVFGESLDAFGPQPGLNRSPGIASQVLETAEENKYLIAGGLLATGFAVKFPEVTSNLLQGSFFVLGAAAGTAFLAALKTPIVLLALGVSFGPELLTKAAESGAIRKLGVAIGDGIVKFFEEDAEGRGVFKRIFDAILLGSTELGGGLLEGLNLGFKTNEIADTIAGVVSIALVTAGAAGILLNGTKSFAGTIAKLLFGLAFKTASFVGITGVLGGVFEKLSLEAQTSPKLEKARQGLNKAGGLLGKSFKAGLSGSFAQLTADAIVPDDALGGLGEALDGAIGGAVAGAQLGAIGGPLGVAIGAAVGGVVGLAFDVLNNEELMSSIKGIGTKLYDIVVVDLPNAIIDAFNKATSSVKSWFRSIFSTGGDTGAISSFEGQTQADFIQMGIKGKASGGYISGPGGPRDDSIPAMLSNGEFVIQASAVKKFGAGFLSMINNGMMPQKFMDGGYASLISRKAYLQNQVAKEKQIIRVSDKTLDKSSQNTAIKNLADANEALAAIEAQLSKYDEDGNLKVFDLDIANGNKNKPSGDGDGDGENKQAESLASSFQEDFRAGFYNALRTGDFSTIFGEIAESFTSKVIESFATGFTDSLFEGLGLSGENGILENLFAGTEQFGTKIGSGISKTITDSWKESEAGNGGLLKSLGGLAKSLFQGLGSVLSEAFNGLTSMLSGGSGGSSIFSSFSGIFSGIQGFGSNIMSSISSGFSSFTSFLGFSEGGLVPNTAYSRAGMDSVPAMLTPGELVVPADKISDFTDLKTKSQQVYNINVSGDVSRQTRKEIVKMLPEITSGVNMNNRENNYRR